MRRRVMRRYALVALSFSAALQFRHADDLLYSAAAAYRLGKTWHANADIGNAVAITEAQPPGVRAR